MPKPWALKPSGTVVDLTTGPIFGHFVEDCDEYVGFVCAKSKMERDPDYTDWLVDYTHEKKKIGTWCLCTGTDCEHAVTAEDGCKTLLGALRCVVDNVYITNSIYITSDRYSLNHPTDIH